ncbi:MAG TPA: type 4a pilus biogenesis protein PilO [Syntrophorhabdales bacterium]|nr:type 4a pilus biogenesis protein PilO [Syntrophorhabdales bacterium]
MRFKALYVWIAAPILGAVLWFFAWYMPMKTEINNKQVELKEAKQQTQRVESDIKALTEMKRKEDGIKASLKEYRGQIPLFDNFPAFIYEVAGGARKNGLVLDKFSGMFKTLDMQPKTILTYPSFEVGLKGRFLEMGKFLEQVSSSRAYRKIMKGTISYNEKEYPIIAGRFEVEFKAWKERAAIESQ